MLRDTVCAGTKDEDANRRLVLPLTLLHRSTAGLGRLAVPKEPTLHCT